MFFKSRFLFRDSLGSQKSKRDLGSRAKAHRGWRCQKHPWTRTIFRRRTNTKSGFPGRERTWSLYLKPREKAMWRTAFSGFVSLARMSAMRRLRSDLVKVSKRRLRNELHDRQSTSRTQSKPLYSRNAAFSSEVHCPISLLIRRRTNGKLAASF